MTDWLVANGITEPFWGTLGWLAVILAIGVCMYLIFVAVSPP